MPQLFRPLWFDHPNNIWWSVQVMKHLIMQSFPASRHIIPLRYQYSPRHPSPNSWLTFQT
jgi:hypothetical protein